MARTSIILITCSLLQLLSLNLIIVVLISVNNAPLPNHVYSLPPNMQA
jgi:hypothetical protein